MSSAQPGWYPAGVPGRERWWDGTQWTAHERDAVAQPPAAPAPQHSGVQQYGAEQPAGPAMGWYTFRPSGQPRWWNGVNWTGYHVKNGRPSVNAYAVEPPIVGWVLGGAMLLLALLNFLRSLVDPSAIAMAVLFTALGITWLVGAAQDRARRKVPAPTTAPMVEQWMRPFPGEAEGASAGWYPVTGSILRWWTGARWAEYITEKGTVRPTQFGPRSYRNSMIVAAVFGGVGLIGLVTGIILTSMNSDSTAGIASIIVGAVTLFVAGIVWLVVRIRRYALLIPPHPPKQLS